MSTAEFAEILAKAGRRQAEIDRRVAAAQKELDDRIKARQGKGSGRLPKAEQMKDDNLNKLLVRLKRGYLPGEVMSNARAPPEQVAASARQNAAHHAAGTSAPSGRPARAGNGSSGNGSDDDGGGAGSSGGSSGAEADPDDSEPDERFRHYYSITSQQAAFNACAVAKFKSGAANIPSATFTPTDVVKAGCDRSLIGVGACHVHAPHKYLGLPLPPCPKCGWKSVDGQHVSTRGYCAARRVYSEGIDEWLVGHKCVCARCKKEHDRAAGELAELEDDDAPAEEIAEAKAAVAAAQYCYRSYNHESMKIYAERYAWCACTPSALPVHACSCSH